MKNFYIAPNKQFRVWRYGNVSLAIVQLLDPLSPINPLPSIIVSHKPQLVHLGYLILADPALGGARLGELDAEVLLQRSGRREAAAPLAARRPLPLQRGGNHLAEICMTSGTTFDYIHMTHHISDLGWVDLDLGSSSGWWAATKATYSPGRIVHGKLDCNIKMSLDSGTSKISVNPIQVRQVMVQPVKARECKVS